MPGRRSLTLSMVLLFCVAVAAKDKKKATLPADVLQARTAWVIIDPQAGVDVEDPDANRQARAEVDAALERWGRLTVVNDPSRADLIIVVRRGHSRVAQPTIGGTPINAPQPQIGQLPEGGQPPNGGMGAPGRTGMPQEPMDPHPQMEIGTADDTFAVYRGNPAYSAASSGDPLEAPAVWRYQAKDALASPGVPAVDQFRRAIADSEKALNQP